MIINKLPRAEISKLISSKIAPTVDFAALKRFEQWVACSQKVWCATEGESFICMWGIIPPTLLSDQAYLWLHTGDGFDGNEFIFVRHSQRAAEEVLKIYDQIVGHVQVGQDKSIKWLRWLGAEFYEPERGFIPFVIRKKHG